MLTTALTSDHAAKMIEARKMLRAARLLVDTVAQENPEVGAMTLEADKAFAAAIWAVADVIAANGTIERNAAAV